MWVYATTLNAQGAWLDEPAGTGILTALTAGDTEFVYKPQSPFPSVDPLDLSMPQSVGQIHLRVRRSNTMLGIASITLIFFLDGGGTDSHTIDLSYPMFTIWQDYYYTPTGSWSRIQIDADTLQETVGISVLRAGTVGLSRRTLTGVGI